MGLFRFQNIFASKHLRPVHCARVRAQEVFRNEKFHPAIHHFVVRDSNFLACRRTFHQYFEHYAANRRRRTSDSALASVLSP